MLNNQIKIKVNLGEDNRVDMSRTALLGEKCLPCTQKISRPMLLSHPNLAAIITSPNTGKIIPKIMLHHHKKGTKRQLNPKKELSAYFSLLDL